MLTLEMFALLVVLGTASALDPTSTFHYMKYPTIFRRNNVVCQVCYGNTTATATSCVGFDKFRCSYAAAIQALRLDGEVQKEAKTNLTVKVDSMMYELVFEDSLQEYKECMPLISSYSQCNKENMCTGCKSCECDERGQWNCTELRQCSKRALNVDHRVLQTVIDSLKFGPNRKIGNRHKRSHEVSEPSQSLYEELPAWMYKPTKVKFTSDTKPWSTAVGKNVSTITTIKPLYNDDYNNVIFDELLDNEELKPFINSNEKYIRNEDRKDVKQDSRYFFGGLQNIEEDREAKEEDLNEPRNSSSSQLNSLKTMIDNIYYSDIDDQNPGLNYTAFALKRHARNVKDTPTRNETTRQKDITTKNVTDTKDELEHLVQILTMLINTQRIEMEHLNYIKHHLLKYINKYKVNSKGTDELNKHGTYSDNHHSTRDWKVNMLHFYTNKFRGDMKIIIKDINALQKLKKLGVAPVTGSMSNLKPLLFALTSFYHKINEDNTVNTKKYSWIPNFEQPFDHSTTSVVNNISESNNLLDHQTSTFEPKPQRRLFDSYKVILIKRALVRILVIIDNNKFTTALSTLSPRTKDIMSKIIEKQYVNDRPLGDPNLNFKVIEMLANLSSIWQNGQLKIYESKPSDRLYTLKLMHLTLSQSIDKMKCALNAMQFRSTRRMEVVEKEIGEDLMTNVTKFLEPLDSYINNFVFKATKENEINLKPLDKKQSVWHKIKKTVANTKNRLTKYILNKLKVRPYIVNEMATKRANEVNEQKFFEVMKEWQQKLDTFNARDKRSATHFAKRLKNIIPKYLRGKVNPALVIKRKGDKNKNMAKEKKAKNKTKLELGDHKEPSRRNPTMTPPIQTTMKSKHASVKLILRHIQQ